MIVFIMIAWYEVDVIENFEYSILTRALEDDLRITKIEVFQSELVKLGVVRPDQFFGCTDTEIGDLMKDQGVTSLPRIYVQLLKKLGNGAGRFQKGTSFYRKLLFEIKPWVKEIADDNQWILPDEAFIFSEHQGYIFLFFNTTEGDDPPVYLIRENRPPRKIYDSFSELLASYVDEYKAYADAGLFSKRRGFRLWLTRLCTLVIRLPSRMR